MTTYPTGPDSATPACQGKDPELWFPLPTESAQPARAICRTCPVRDDCLNYALKYAVAGIWAATDPGERAALRTALDIVPLPVVPGGRVR